MNIIQKPVKNFEKGRKQFRPEIIVIHIEKEPGFGSKEAVYSEFINAEKSSHYCVNKDGSIWQFVKEEDTAWANGRIDKPTSKLVVSRGKTNPNLYSISIEHEVLGPEPKGINELQYQTTANLIKEISQRWLIPLDREHIIGHREIYSLKTCPGNIDISRLISLIDRFKPDEVAENIVKTKESLDSRFPKAEADTIFKKFLSLLFKSWF